MKISTALITGLPGSGKSLLAVELIKLNADSEEPRPLFTNVKGIDKKSLRCFSLNNEVITSIRADNYPPGSIFVIDEAQEHYPPRANGARKPEHIALFEVRRHSGYDFIILTQHPKLIDKNIRVLLSDHYHNVRPFGMGYRNVLHWNTVNEDPEPNQSASTAVVTKKTHDKELFKFYKSSVEHNVKKTIPKKPFIIIGVCVLVVVLASFYTYKSLSPKEPIKAPEVKVEPGKLQPIIDDRVADPDEGDLLPNGFIGNTVIHNDFGVFNDVIFRYLGDMYYLSDYEYSYSSGSVTVKLSKNTSFTFDLPLYIDL